MESLALRREIGDKPRVAWSLLMLARLAQERDDAESARGALEESLALFREVGDLLGQANALRTWGVLESALGDTERAGALLAESLSLFHQIGVKSGIGECLIALAAVAAQQHDVHAAAMLCGAAEALRAELDADWEPPERAGYERCLAVARTRLDDSLFTSALAAGRSLSSEQAVRFALDIHAAPALSSRFP
jgi:tetratricopeptide (TPR) repeat protein